MCCASAFGLGRHRLGSLARGRGERAVAAQGVTWTAAVPDSAPSVATTVVAPASSAVSCPEGETSATAVLWTLQLTCEEVSLELPSLKRALARKLTAGELDRERLMLGGKMSTPTGTAGLPTKVTLPVATVSSGRTKDPNTVLEPDCKAIATPRLSTPFEMATTAGLALDHRV